MGVDHSGLHHCWERSFRISRSSLHHEMLSLNTGSEGRGESKGESKRISQIPCLPTVFNFKRLISVVRTPLTSTSENICHHQTTWGKIATEMELSLGQ